MPTTKARKQANGQTRYTAIVRIRPSGVIPHREGRTFQAPECDYHLDHIAKTPFRIQRRVPPP